MRMSVVSQTQEMNNRKWHDPMFDSRWLILYEDHLTTHPHSVKFQAIQKNLQSV
jgi:hypothetical protein